VAAVCFSTACRGQFQPAVGSQVRYDIAISGRAAGVGRPFAARLGADTIYAITATNTLTLVTVGVFVVCGLGIVGLLPFSLTVATMRVRRALILAFVGSFLLTVTLAIGLFLLAALT
jgi:hypothetical protein